MTKDELREHLKELDEATKGIREAMAPFVRAMDAVTGVREALLEEHETEVIDTCGGCGDVLLVGDRGFSYSDGPTCCECPARAAVFDESGDGYCPAHARVDAETLDFPATLQEMTLRVLQSMESDAGAQK